MSFTKLSWVGLGFILLSAGVYFVFIHQPDQTVFEQSSETSEADPKTLTPQTSLPTNQTPSTFLEVLPTDCSQECTNFALTTDQYAYCRSVCGLPLTPPDETTEVKTTDPALSKAIQQKDEAIKNQDLSQCNNITDTNLRKACQVRITEDLLE